MQFIIEDSPAFLQVARVPWVYAEGVIDDSAPARFEALVRAGRIAKGSTVFLDSPGGSLEAGMTLGRLFRRESITTRIGKHPPNGVLGKQTPREAAMCASACAYAYFGGRYRWAPIYDDRFGIHQFYYSDTNVADVGALQQAAGEVVDYLRDMGINPGVFAAAASTNSNSVLWISAEDMVRFGLSNDGKEAVTATLKLLQGHPYLTLDQQSVDGELKFAFMCAGKGVSVIAYHIVGGKRAKEIVDGGGRSYMEVNEQPILIKDSEGAAALNNAVVTLRIMDISAFDAMLRAKSIGAYLDDRVQGLRTGFTMQIDPVRAQLQDYYDNCHALMDSK